MIELIVVLLILVAFGIRTSWFQTYLAQKTANYLSGELGTEIAIDKVDIVFFDRADIEGIYVEDKIKDTLLFSESIHVNIGDFSLSESYVDIDLVELTNVSANIIKYKGDSTLNFQHIIDYFASEEVDTSASSPFTVNVEALALNNINFVYQDQNAEPLVHGLDYADLNIQNLSGEFSNFSVEGDSIMAKIKDLRFRDHSGLMLSKFSTDLLYSSKLIALRDLKIGLNNTLLISDQLELRMPNGPDDFGNFVHNVYFKGNIRNSGVNLADLAFFVPSIHGMDNRVALNNIEIQGPVFGMRLDNVDITMLDSTIIRGDFRIPNLDDPEQANFNERLDIFQTTVSDVERIKLTPFLDGSDYLDLPASMDLAGLIQLKNAHFDGYLSNFVADGDLTSGLGNVHSDYGLQFELDTASGIYYYKCGKPGVKGKDIIVENLNLGALTDNPMLGLISGYLSINEGSRGLSMDDLSVNFDGKFDLIELNDYSYNGILIKEGLFANNRFDGEIEIDDDNLELNYDGYVDLNNDMHFVFEVKIDSARLAELNNETGGLVDVFKSKVKVDIKGTSPEAIKGNISVKDLVYREDSIDFELKELNLAITRNEKADSVILDSDLIDLRLIGKFDFANMWLDIQHQLSRVAGNVIEDVDMSASKNEAWDLEIILKDVNPLMQFTEHEVYVAENSHLETSYNRKDLKLLVHLNSDLVLYDGKEFQDINLKNYFDSLRSNVQYEIGSIKLSDSLQVNNAAFFSYIKDNNLSTNIGWDGSGSVEPALFAFNTELKENKDILTHFKPSFFFLKDHKWDISPESELLWNNRLFKLSNFNITNGDHLIGLDGKVSENPDDWLYFQIRDFDLTDLNGLLGGAITIGGVLNVDGGVSDVYNNIRFMSLSDIQGFVIDNELVGDLLIDNKWDKENKSVNINGNLKRGKKETFKFSGDYFTEREKNNIDLDLIFDYTDIGFLNAFSDPEMYTDIEGVLNGKLKVTGELVDPVIKGKLDVVTANVMVPMFNVSFGISGELGFGKDEIIVDFMNVYDQEGNNALAQMQIYHYDWADWNYDITLDMEGPLVSERFLAMNTEYKDGDFYYGKAYVSGDVNIFGYDGLTEITVNAITKEGTDLKLAMYGSGDIEESSFIVFDTIVPFYKQDTLGSESIIENSGLVMDLNFDISKETKATIVFDPIYNDQIEVDAGEGKIALDLDEYGEMDMYGDYTIYKGAYNMNVKGLVKREFVLGHGSTLKWTKSPYDALIDIRAEYTKEVSLKPILPLGIEDDGGKEPVVATLVMSNTLMSPAISFEIAAPEADEIGKAAVAAIQADKDQLNKQFFAVVALSKFMPINGVSGTTGSAALDFADSQLDAILEKFDEGLGVGLNGGAGTTVDYEKKINEKITIKTSLGVVAGDDQNTGNIIGDVVIEYQPNEDGSTTINVFNESNTGADAEKGPFTQGASLHYEETFNTWQEFRLLQGFLNIFRKKENDVILRKRTDNGKKRAVPAEGEELDSGPENSDAEDDGSMNETMGKASKMACQLSIEKRSS